MTPVPNMIFRDERGRLSEASSRHWHAPCTEETGGQRRVPPGGYIRVGTGELNLRDWHGGENQRDANDQCDTGTHTERPSSRSQVLRLQAT